MHTSSKRFAIFPCIPIRLFAYQEHTDTMYMHIYVYASVNVYAYARVFCIQTRYDAVRFLAAFVGYSLCEIHHRHTHICKRHILQSIRSWLAYCHCPVYLDFHFYFFSSFDCAHAFRLHTYNFRVRLQPRPFLLCHLMAVSIFLFAFVCLCFFFF